jgi:hypothetical protein
MNAPQYKRVVILANSVKHHHWCVAGREIFFSKGKWSPGLWIRPVDPAHEGAITSATMQLGPRRTPKIFDIVDIPILGWLKDQNHPEDWLVDTRHSWLHQGVFPLAQLEALVERPTHLWKGWTDTRKTRVGYVSKMLRPASLYFIKPEGEVKARIFWDEEKKRIKQRLHLRYAGQDNEFDITDPLFGSNYLGPRRPKGSDPIEITLPADGRLHLCLSLTPEFHGAHYKIAATIWEAPPP